MFDTLFLLAAGRCIYHGPSNDVLSHFQSIGFQCEEHNNPADFLLDVCQGDYQSDTNQNRKQFIHFLNNNYEKSSIYSTIKEEAKTLQNSSKQSSTIKQDIRKKSRLSEIFYVSQRTLRNAFRNPALIGMQTGVSIFLGVLIGLIYLNTNDSMDVGLKNRIGAIFFITTNQVFGSLSALDLFIKERPLFQHENVSGYYHVSTYFMSKLLCDVIPLRLIPSILFSVIAYFMIGFQKTVEKYFIFLLGIYSTTICASSLCFFISASVRVFGIANLTAAMFCVLTLVFSGFLVDVSSVVSFLSWIKWISIFRYSNNIFAINEFVGLTLYSKNNTEPPLNGIEILKEQNIEYSIQWDLWKNFVALAGITLSFLILAYIQLFRMKKTK